METASPEELPERVITAPDIRHFSSVLLQKYCVSLAMDASTLHKSSQGVM